MNDMRADGIIYGFDPLCGWCFGFIPALEALARARPDIPITLRLGGLVTGERVRPYAEMRSYIETASARMAAVTGQALAPAFFERILARDDVISSSIPPSEAIRQVRTARPDQAIAYAHAVQRAHFNEGQDLNDPNTYRIIGAKLALDLPIDLPGPQDQIPLLVNEFEATRSLGITAFPTVLVNKGGQLQSLPSIYDPDLFIAQIGQALQAPAGAAMPSNPGTVG